jgi:hypothetical protein
MRLTNPSTTLFVWKHYHPREAEDMQVIWGAAWRAGGRDALNDSTRLVELVPLRDLLDALDDERIEREVRSSDRRWPGNKVNWSEEDDERYLKINWDELEPDCPKVS